MSSRKLFAMACAVVLLGSCALAAGGQMSPPAKPAKKPNLMQRMFGKKKDAGKTNGHGKPMIHGQIVGNKNTKVYHMPGDKGNMPVEKNRVYFKSEAEAQAAGYHRAGTPGQGKATGKTSGMQRGPKAGRVLKK